MISSVRHVKTLPRPCLTPLFTASYLSELRSSRVSRPGGARPLPSGARPAPSRTSTGRTSRASTGRPSFDSVSQAESVSGHQRMSSHTPSIAAGSVSSRYSNMSARGRDYYPATPAAPLQPNEVVPSATYMERGQRWMEKEEAFSLRDAMEEMDLQHEPKQPASDEGHIYDAALDEAAELVWQHQHGESIPRPDGPYRYRPHLRKNSYAHARTASIGRHGGEIAPSGLARDSGSRSVSGSSTDSDGCSRRSSGEQPSRKAKPYGSVEGRRRSSMKRNISGEVQRPFSGDQIWEEPETSSISGSVTAGRVSPEKLGSKPQNASTRVHFEPSREDLGATKIPNRIEIHRNPPSRTRDAQYTSNSASLQQSPTKELPVEKRSDDIRNATSMRMKDRSSKLPEPTAVSDRPGRPIVSFDTNWKAPDASTDARPGRQSPAAAATPPPSSRPQHGSRPMAIPSIVVAEDTAPRSRAPPRAGVPSISVAGPDENRSSSMPPIPSINVPTIAIDEAPAGPSIPVIVTPDDAQSTRARPLPTPGAKGAPARRAQRPRGHWSPAPGTSGRATAICHECGFPIEGRFVALAGSPERFHPQCFSCFACGTGLEAMEISPEPAVMRAERLERIQRRAAGDVLDEHPGMTEMEDGDDRLRFYCHLDWHEQFAPRCAHCKTPILGEHVVALGQHWHNGHFFCAECGDPFSHGMTHIEKDGYAWCINCQTKRTERRAPKCCKCRTAVIGQYVEALGGEWHDHCFRCADCQGGFDDGQIFPKDVPGGGTVVLCTGCRAKELKL